MIIFFNGQSEAAGKSFTNMQSTGKAHTLSYEYISSISLFFKNQA